MNFIISIFLVLFLGISPVKGRQPETLFRHLQPVTAKSISPSEKAGSPGIYRMEP